ncbi:hypothetical protein LXL04_022345 [Taraxacum kok-saghyz]
MFDALNVEKVFSNISSSVTSCPQYFSWEHILKKAELYSFTFLKSWNLKDLHSSLALGITSSAANSSFAIISFHAMLTSLVSWPGAENNVDVHYNHPYDMPSRAGKMLQIHFVLMIEEIVPHKFDMGKYNGLNNLTLRKMKMRAILVQPGCVATL